MIFNSFRFAFFFFIVFVAYFWLVPRKWQWLILLAAGTVFYISFSGWLVVVLYATGALAFFAALNIERVITAMKAALAQVPTEKKEEKAAIKASHIARKRRMLAMLVAASLLILAVFKFGNVVLKLLPEDWALANFSVLMPIGISFYTLQLISYVVDVYRGKIKAEKNYLHFMLYMSFFPQVIQGPIPRYGDLAVQLTAEHSPEWNRTLYGLQRMLWGYAKKLIVADRLVLLVDYAFENSGSLYGSQMFFAVLMYTFQLYADFSGGIDIAIGCAEILGIKMTENFRQPYFSQTLSEYWRRWHITLGTWFKDYVFYPVSTSTKVLTLSRNVRARHGKMAARAVVSAVGLGCVWVLNGIWHGTGWNFLLFGVWHGVMLILGNIFGDNLNALTKKLKIQTETFSWRLYRTLRTFGLVLVGCLIYRSTSVKQLCEVTANIFTRFKFVSLFNGDLVGMGLDGPNLWLSLAAVAVWMVAEYAQQKESLRDVVARQNVVFRWGVWLVLIACVLVFGYYGYGYNASSFVYSQY